MKIRHEINFICGTFTVSAATGPKARIDLSKFNGALSVYLEVIYTSTSTSNTFRFDSSSGGIISISSPVAASMTLYRVAITGSNLTALQANTTWWQLGVSQASGQTITLKAGRLIIIQDTGVDDLTATEQQYEIGNFETGKVSTSQLPLTAPKYWKYNAANYDGTTTFFADVSYITSGTGTFTIVLQESSATLTAPTWSNKVTIVSAGTSITGTHARSASFTPVDGRMYRITVQNSSTMGTHGVQNAKIIIQQTGTVTLLEEQYLLGNTSFAAGTALQNFLSTWDSTEWDATNTYYHQIEASDNNTSVVEVDTAAGTQLTGSSVSSPDNLGISSLSIFDSDTAGSSGTLASSNGTFLRGQSVVGNGSYIQALAFRLARTGNPVCTITAEIYAATGTHGTNATPTGSALATSASVAGSTIGPPASTFVSLSFSTPYQLQSGVTYIVVLKIVATSNDGSNYISFDVDETLSHGGNMSTSSGGSWSVNSTFDLNFRAYLNVSVTMPSNGNIDTKATTNSGNIYANRLVVAVVKSATTPPPSSFIPRLTLMGAG